jgi:disulfide bond formation protein DsbB
LTNVRRKYFIYILYTRNIIFILVILLVIILGIILGIIYSIIHSMYMVLPAIRYIYLDTSLVW